MKDNSSWTPQHASILSPIEGIAILKETLPHCLHCMSIVTAMNVEGIHPSVVMSTWAQPPLESSISLVPQLANVPCGPGDMVQRQKETGSK